jgi:hypothetical protein
MAVAAERLLLSDDETDAGRLPALGLRLALEEGEMTTAARLFGHVEANPIGITKDALAEANARFESDLPETESDRLMAEGAAADTRQVLGWLREI